MELTIHQAQNVEQRLELGTEEMAGSRQVGALTPEKPQRRRANGAEK